MNVSSAVFETLGAGWKSQGKGDCDMSGDTPVVIIMVMLIGAVAAILIVGLTLRYRRRELQHKERLAAMEKGAPLPALTDFEQRAPWTPRMYLLRGLMWLFGGIGLTLFLLAVSSA